jgi:quinol-cytochrome oxidoreductase complex cytochrome b subunit
MTNTSTLLLVPFILAFLIFVLRFYNREGASSMMRLSFMLAILTVLIAGSYLILGVVGALPPYSTIGFALVGLILLGTAILRMFMI